MPAQLTPLSWRQQVALAALLALALALRLWASTRPWLSLWDEAFHAVVAKHLAAHPLHPTLFDDPALPSDDSSWLRAHTWLHKPPLALWAMAASIARFGATVWAARLPSVLLDTCAVALTFGIGRTLFGARVGFVAAGAHALYGHALLLICGYHSTDHIDLQLMFWVEAAVFCAVRYTQVPQHHRWLLGMGLCSGLALLTKAAPGVLAIGVWAVAAPRPLGRRAVEALGALALALAVAAPWWWWVHQQWPAIQALESKDQLDHLLHASEGHGANPLYYLVTLGQTHGLAIYAALAFGLWRAFRGDWSHRFIAAWWLVPAVLFSVAATKMLNYLAPAAPALFVMLGLLAEEAARTRWAKVALAAVVATALITLRHDLHRIATREPDDAAFAAAAAALPPRTIVLNVAPYPQAMFFGAYAAYPDVWPRAQRDAVRAMGYSVVVACAESEQPPPSWPRSTCAQKNPSLGE